MTPEGVFFPGIEAISAGALVAIARGMLEFTQDTALGWQQLIRALDANPRLAALKYESIRRQLVRIFRERGHAACEELADRVIDRVACRLERGLILWPGKPEGYFYRVAHYMALEASRKEASARRALRHLVERDSAAEENTGREQRLGMLEARVRALDAEDRRLLLRYYEGEGQARIQNRRRLAAELGMSLNTLRVRMHRIRAELERTLEEVQAAA
jgi:DNA-directed RNA polymerase specialized sigma24 family protein